MFRFILETDCITCAVLLLRRYFSLSFIVAYSLSFTSFKGIRKRKKKGKLEEKQEIRKKWLPLLRMTGNELLLCSIIFSFSTLRFLADILF